MTIARKQLAKIARALDISNAGPAYSIFSPITLPVFIRE